MKRLALLIVSIALFTACAAPASSQAASSVVSSAVVSWRDNLPADLADQIATAFTEIGENPDNIKYIEYMDTHPTMIFDKKCYKVEFQYTFGNPKWEHARDWVVVTQDYYEGEPEDAEIPGEFLIGLKFWAGDDGHGTNIYQWSWKGRGEMQNDGN